MYEMHFGVPMSGAVLNTINTRLDPRTVSVLLRHSSSKLVFVDPLSLPILLSALPSSPPPTPLPSSSPSTTPTSRNKPLRCTPSPPPTRGSSRRRATRGSSGCGRGASGTPWCSTTPRDDLGAQGRGALPRGLFLITVDSLVDWSVPPHPVFLWTLPMFHANGWSFPWGVAAVAGTNVCLRRVDAPAVFSALRRHRCTHMCGAPVVLNMLANSPPPPTRLPRLRPRQRPHRRRAPAGRRAPPRGEARVPRQPRVRPHGDGGAGGVRTPCMAAVDVVDAATGRPVPRDGAAVGEIVLRGGCIMLGYLKDAAATAQAIRGDGWFYTGDVGVMHPDGYLEIKDRSKDVIISGGENISSVEVESILYGHPAVDEAAVVARPDEFWGETPCAFVSLKKQQEKKQEQPTAEEVIAWCRERMPHYMVPKTVIFEDELPKTSTGKIQKYVLRSKAKQMGPGPPAAVLGGE
uniref:Acyl-activating enzyme 5, peroxisomal n=1 Tax=Ananas comosus var. bracteatus TaxID=296719 RepID=A0A6V7QD71_ANACO|nr:unnamed protein product [Ananas comosus var. bracteatus]